MADKNLNGEWAEDDVFSARFSICTDVANKVVQERKI
jgi:hypothetical protein